MKKALILAAACAVASLTPAAPIPSGQLQLRVQVRPCADNYQAANTTYNPRFFDEEIYATQLNYISRCIGRYATGSGTYLGGTIPPNNEHRMLGRLRGAGGTTYLIGSGGVNLDNATFSPTFTRYDSDMWGSNPTPINAIDDQVVEGFDWVDDDTLISTCYVSPNRKRLYLTDVVANPFAITRNTTWNVNGYVETAVTTRIRNVRVGDVYRGFAYYGDAGQNSNPNFYAINLTNGVSTLLGNAGALTGGGSFGLWTVLERGGYLYVQTTDNGIQVYNLANATTLGALATAYSKAELDAATGYTGQYYGLDVSKDGQKLLLGGGVGSVYELGRKGAPYLPAQLQLSVIVRPYADLGKSPTSMYNPRWFDGKIYATEISTAAYACFGVYPSGSSTRLAGAIPATEHRMLAPFRGTNSLTYLLASGGAFSTTFTRYDFDGNNPQAVDFVDSQPVESFDWVNAETIICNDYASGNRSRLYLAKVVANPFSLSRNTLWNANGYITSAATTRVRNVRVGDVYSGYAYYGDNGVSVNPKVYALNLATGIETELGSWNGTLKAGTAGGAATGSWGLWTVVERRGYLYLQSSDDGVQVYNMTSATTLGSLHAAYSDAVLDAVTTDVAGSAYYGFDVSPDGREWLFGSYVGKVYEVGPPRLSVSRLGADLILAWPDSVTAVVVQAAASLTTGFADLDPQPSVIVNGNSNTVTIPPGPDMGFFRLRKSF